VGHDAGGGVQPGDAELPSHDDLRLARPVGRDPVQMRVAAVLHHEQQVFAVPDGLAHCRIRPAVAIQLLGEDAPLARRHFGHCDLDVAGIVHHSRLEEVRDPRPVRGPRGSLARPVGGRELRDRLSIRVGHVDVAGRRDVPVFVPG
jgi:hypothetical protein